LAEKNIIHLCKMRFATRQTVFFENHIFQNLSFEKTWQEMENTKTAANAADAAGKKMQKCKVPLVERQKICYT